MTEQGDAPAPRIGDAERDDAARMLSDHLASGRLDQQEFGDRVGAALRARTAADLEPLFADLPEPRPHGGATAVAFTPPPWQDSAAPPTAAPVRDLAAVQPPPQVPQKRISTALAVVGGLAWPAAVILCFATDWRYWWIILIPMLFPWWLRQDQHRGPGRDRHRRGS